MLSFSSMLVIVVLKPVRVYSKIITSFALWKPQQNLLLGGDA